MWIKYNPNPTGRTVGDCTVRAVTAALNVDWGTAFNMLVEKAYQMGDMPSADSVWGAVLRQNGFYREAIPNRCPNCFTVEDFAKGHPNGVYVLGIGGHVVTIVNGDWYDSWNSKNEIPIYYWYQKEQYP